jgi:hypothetical protein
MSQETKVYKIKGSNREELEVTLLLGTDPQIQSVCGGKFFYISLTRIQCQMLINNGFEVGKK